MSETKTSEGPKTLELKTRVFEANGRKYYVTDKLSMKRWKEYEKLVPRLAYGCDFKDVQNTLLKVWEALNNKHGRLAEASVLVHNLMSAINDVEDEKRIHPAMLVAALCINREGEGWNEYDENLQLEKIEDWEKEGYDVNSFFQFALTTISGLRETYIAYIEAEAKKAIKAQA
jgi:hypothetical protein